MAEFTKIEAHDLERYLDATRGEMLFAKGVVLVEGYAELYVIPVFAKLLEKPIDERGISVCSVHGTDFLPYARLLGEGVLDIPYVIITDGDPYLKNDQIIYRGNIRGVSLAIFQRPHTMKELNKLVEDRDWGKLDECLQEFGTFVGNKTLEIDLCEEGYDDEFIETIKELGAGKKRQEKFGQALKNKINGEVSDKDATYIISTIENFGKGRFAQRFAPKLTRERIPSYIENAINHIVERVAGE